MHLLSQERSYIEGMHAPIFSQKHAGSITSPAPLSFPKAKPWLQGSFQNQQVVVKVYNLKIKGSTEALMNETRHLSTDPPVSSAVPAFISFGKFPATAVPYLLMSDCGDQLELKDGKIPSKLHPAVEKAIKAFHSDVSCCHRDLHPRNLVQDSQGQERIVDLASMVPAALPEQKAELAAFCKAYM